MLNRWRRSSTARSPVPSSGPRSRQHPRAADRRAAPVRAYVSELVGTALLLTAVVGSGIMGERLAGGNVAIALLANTLATGATLVTLILTFGPISGAHLNPVVSFADASQGGMSWATACRYAVAQFAGAILGVGAANYMFQEPLYAWSRHARGGLPMAFSEVVATFGLLATIWGCSRRRSAFIAAQIIGGAAATALFRWLVPALPATSDQVVMPHRQARP
jgi:glycerol uptake facilitator-like aquaporin